MIHHHAHVNGRGGSFAKMELTANRFCLYPGMLGNRQQRRLNSMPKGISHSARSAISSWPATAEENAPTGNL